MKLWHESAGAELPASRSGGSSDGAESNFSYVPTPYFSLLVGTQRDMVGPPHRSRVPLVENNFPVCTFPRLWSRSGTVFSCVGASVSHSEQPFSTGDSQDAPIGGGRDLQLFSCCTQNFHQQIQQQLLLLLLPSTLLLLTSQTETRVMLRV